MNIKWFKTESTIRPKEIDTLSSPTTVYLRKNIQEIEREDFNEQKTIIYKYDEAALTFTEYQTYLIEKQKSEIDYIAMMSDIDLEVV